MDRFLLKVIGLALLASILCSRGVGAPPCGAGCLPQGDIAAAIRQTLSSGTETWQSSPGPRQLYEKVSYQPLWIVEARASAQARQVIDYLDAIQDRGLRPADYPVDELRSRVATLDSGATPVAQLAHFDLAMSSALLHLLSDLHRGRVDPFTLGADVPVKEGQDLAAVVVAVSRAEHIAPAIESVEPPYPGYAALIRALARFRVLAADTSLRAPADPRRVIRPGDAYEGVASLARLLAAFGDLPETAVGATARYDGAVVEAVRAFQGRHGLEPDGTLGSATMAALRVPPSARIRQIELALERWRWMPYHVPDRYILVNVPEFRLRAFDRDGGAQPAVTLNVIVGRAGRSRQTPVFSAAMREVVFHPYWDVPVNIARNELLPAARRKPGYLAAGGYEIVRGSDEYAQVFPPDAANLARVAAGTLRIRQRPGPLNALGRVKLAFPNSHNVFLHDTPERSLFARARRDFSHGCIRVERPVTLVEFVLGGDRDWDAARIDSALGVPRTRHIPVSRPLTVFVQYFTAYIGETGDVRFAPDIYRRDEALSAALTSRSN